MTIVASWKNPNYNQPQTEKTDSEGKRFIIMRENTEKEKAKVFSRQQYIDNTHEMPILHWVKQASK